MYDTLVNAMRAQISPNVEILNTKVVEVATSDERQRLVLADGEDNFCAPDRACERS